MQTHVAKLEVEIAEKQLELFGLMADAGNWTPIIGTDSVNLEKIETDAISELLTTLIEDLEGKEFTLRRTKYGRVSGYFKGDRLLRFYPNKASVAVRIKTEDNTLGPRISINTLDAWQTIFNEWVQPKMDEVKG
jgi:hypothetical protein